MFSEEFLAEALNYEKCPENFAEIYGVFNKYQSIVWDTLMEVKKVFEQNDVNYQLAFGTLLGMVRDGGQIPWDYDIDLFIHFEDRHRAIEALNNSLGAGYCFTCAESKDDAEQLFIRVAPKGFKTKFIHVDIFYYIGMPSDGVIGDKHAENVRKNIQKYVYKQATFTGSWKQNMKFLLGKIGTVFYSKEGLVEQINALCGKYNSYDSDRVANANAHCGKWYYNHDMIAETVLYKCGDIEWKVPIGYREILSHTYGDCGYLPIEKRINEVLRNYKKLTKHCPL